MQSLLRLVAITNIFVNSVFLDGKQKWSGFYEDVGNKCIY